MLAIPNNWLTSLKETLRKCDDVFFSHRNLWILLDNEKLKIWKYKFPEADSFDDRIDRTVAYFTEKENEQGENALYLFLLVLADRYMAEDKRHNLLRALANQVQLMASFARSRREKSSLLEEANPAKVSMTDISEMEQIVACARAVCHIQVPHCRDGECKEGGSGSGWLIAPGLVITCWHVIASLLPGEQQPEQLDVDLQIKQTLIRFDYTRTGEGIDYSVAELIYPSVETQEQDFAILRLKNRDDYPYSQFDYLPIECDTPFNRQVSLSIIQHPLGMVKKIADGYFVDFADEQRRIRYTTPTEGGTSGAPVLNRRNLRVMALHNGENQSKELREGTTTKSILRELEENIPDLYREIMQARQKNITHEAPTTSAEAPTLQTATPTQNATSLPDQTAAQHTHDISNHKNEEKYHIAKDPQEYLPKSRIQDLGVNKFQKNQREFDILLDKLLNGDEALRVGLVGMGGKGKSRLAYEIVQNLKTLKAFPTGIYWMIPEEANKLPRAANDETKKRAWEADFANFAEYCEYIPTDDNEQSPENNARRARYICKYFASSKDCLVVLDNAEDPQYAVNAISTIVSDIAYCTIIYTSRWSDKPKVLYGGKDVYLHTVEKLPDEQAYNLLLEKRPEVLNAIVLDKRSIEAEAVHAILELVDGLPLTLWLLSGLLEDIKDYHTSLLQLLEELQKLGQIEIFDSNTYAQAMLRLVFTLSWERIESEAAKRLLQLMSYYPTITAIPLYLISIAMGEEEQNHLSIKFSQANIHLQKLSLVEKLSSEEVRLHSLICELIQEHTKLNKDTNKLLREQAANHLLDTFTKLNNLVRHAQKQGYWQCLKMVKLASQYIQSLDNDRSELLSRLAYWLQYDSNLLGNGQFWPEPLPELFYQQIHNHLVEENISYEQEDPPERWIPLERSSGRRNSSTQWTHNFSPFADIRGLALSPDSMQVALALYDLEESVASIKIYESMTGYPLSTITDTRLDLVIGIVFTPDNKQIIAGNDSGHLIEWNTRSGAMLREYRLKSDESFTCLAFSPDATIAAVGTRLGWVKLYNLENGEEIAALPCCSAPIEEAVFSSNNLIAARAADQVSIWDIESEKHCGQIERATRCLMFSPDNKLVYGGTDGSVSIQEPSSQRTQRISLKSANAVTCLAFSSDGTKMVVGQENLSTHIWSRNHARSTSLKVVADLSDQQEQVTHVVFSSDNTCIITAGKSGVLHASDVIQAMQFQPRSEPMQKIEDLVFSFNGATALTLTSNQQIQQWKVDSIQRAEVLSSDVIGPAERIMCIASHQQSRLFGLGTLSGRIFLEDCEHPENPVELGKHEGRVTCLAFSPDGSLLVTSSNDKKVHLYEVATKRQMKILSGQSGSIDCLTFTPDNFRLVTGSSNGIIGFWNRATDIFSEVKYKHNMLIKYICISQKGNALIAGTYDGKVYTCIETGSSYYQSSCFSNPTSSEITALACVPWGKLAIICWSNHQTDFVHITDTPGGEICLVGKVTTASRIKAIYWKDDRHFILAGADEATGYPNFDHFVLEGDWSF